jgi:hypothetical protein
LSLRAAAASNTQKENRMATLLDNFASMITPELLAPVAGKIGIDPSLLSKGLGTVVPMLTAGLAKSAASPEGLKSIMGLLPAEATDDIAGLTKSVLGSPDAAALLGKFTDTVFCSAAATATRTVDKALGFPASGLIPLVAPLVMNGIKKAQVAGNLDEKGVAKLLKDETDAFLKKGGPEAEIVTQTWANVDKLNALKGKFSAEELKAVGTAPLAVAGLVMGASKSSAKGLGQELGALAKGMDAAATKAGGVSLVDLFPHPTQEQVEKYLSTPAASMTATLTAAVAAVSAKLPDQAASYKTFLNKLASDIANAAKEGGFLGIGAKQVTSEEEAALEAIRKAVG